FVPVWCVAVVSRNGTSGERGNSPSEWFEVAASERGGPIPRGRQKIGEPPPSSHDRGPGNSARRRKAKSSANGSPSGVLSECNTSGSASTASAKANGSCQSAGGGALRTTVLLAARARGGFIHAAMPSSGTR